MIIWRGTKHGCFTVRSAYFLELERRATEKGERSRKLEQQSFWKSLWSLSIPPVVQNFVWKVCHDILPTKVNLLRRRAMADPYCPFCLVHPETPFHILWICPSSVAVWQESARKIQKLSLVEEGSLGFIQALKNKLDEKSFGEALITMRLIWLRRNSFVFDCGWESPDQVLKKAKRVMEELEDSGPETTDRGWGARDFSFPFFLAMDSASDWASETQLGCGT